MKKLIFYDSKSATSLAATFSVLVKYDDYKLVDINGSDAAAILTLLQAEVANAEDYDHIYVTVSASTFSTSNLAELHTIIAGTTVTTGTCQTNTTATNVVLAAADTAVDDAYNNTFIKVTSGETSKYRIITDYTSSSKVAVIATTTTAITAEDTYLIYTMPNVTYLSTFTTTAWWSLVHSGVNIPIILQNMNTANYRASSTGVGTFNATTITDSHTVGEFNKTDDDAFYLGLHTTGTSGAPQIKRIKSNTATVITLDEAWDVLPVGNLAFYIDRKRNIFNDLYLGYAIPAYLYSTESLPEWRQLLDLYGDLADTDCRQTYHNEATYEKYLALGKAIFTAVKRGIVS